jgi:hypothetical protein
VRVRKWVKDLRKKTERIFSIVRLGARMMVFWRHFFVVKEHHRIQSIRPVIPGGLALTPSSVNALLLGFRPIGPWSAMDFWNGIFVAFGIFPDFMSVEKRIFHPFRGIVFAEKVCVLSWEGHFWCPSRQQWVEEEEYWEELTRSAVEECQSRLKSQGGLMDLVLSSSTEKGLAVRLDMTPISRPWFFLLGIHDAEDSDFLELCKNLAFIEEERKNLEKKLPGKETAFSGGSIRRSRL